MKYVYLVFDADAPADAWAGCGERLLLAADLESAGAPRTRPTPTALAVVEASDLNAAILMASRCPAACSATIEVRPLQPKKELER